MTLNTGQYIERLCSRDRLIKGQTAYTKWSDVLTKVEQAYGVERNILLAIWGLRRHTERHAVKFQHFLLWQHWPLTGAVGSFLKQSFPPR